APVPLLASAEDLRLERRSRPDVKRAHSLGSIELMGRERKEIDAEAVDLEVKHSYRLDGVGVKHDPAVEGFYDAHEACDGLNGADLVIGVHDRHDSRVRPQRPAELIRIDEPFPVHGQISGLEALALELLDCMEDGMVLDCARDDVTAAGSRGESSAAN